MIVDERRSFEYIIVATAGTNTHDHILPLISSTDGSIQIMDLKVTMGNSEAGRGDIYCYLFNDTQSRLLDLFIHELQVGNYYYNHESEGIFVPQTTDKILLRFGFDSAFAADELIAICSYTVRRIVH